MTTHLEIADQIRHSGCSSSAYWLGGVDPKTATLPKNAADPKNSEKKLSDRYLLTIYNGNHSAGDSLFEIYENVLGKLMLLKKFPAAEFTRIDASSVSANSKAIALAELRISSESAQDNKGIITIYENSLLRGEKISGGTSSGEGDFRQIRQIVLEDAKYLITGIDFIDNRRIAVTYPFHFEDESTSDQSGVVSKIAIYDLTFSTPKLIASEIYGGFSSGPHSFELYSRESPEKESSLTKYKKHSYLAIGFAGFDLKKNSFIAPSVLRVYELISGEFPKSSAEGSLKEGVTKSYSLKLTDQKSLPQFPYYISVFRRPAYTLHQTRKGRKEGKAGLRKTLLAVGTQRVQNPFKTNVYLNEDNSESFLKDDYGELRLYKFRPVSGKTPSGKSSEKTSGGLSLLFSEHRNITTAMSFNPTGTHLSICSIASENSSICAFYQLLSYGKKKKIVLKIDSESIFTPASTGAGIFNSNGHLMVLAGGNSDSFAGIHLYRISYASDPEISETIDGWSTLH